MEGWNFARDCNGALGCTWKVSKGGGGVKRERELDDGGEQNGVDPHVLPQVVLEKHGYNPRKKPMFNP
jgi:hypothetical protein